MSTRDFPCQGCGAKLHFAPGKNALKCPYCGAGNTVPQATAESLGQAVEELDYADYLARAAGNEASIERQTVTCSGCGASTQLPDHVTADRCPFCTAPIIAADAYARRTIRPHVVAPFDVDAATARKRLGDWIKGLWFAPNALKAAYRQAVGLKGLYLPYWTYDAVSTTAYEGMRGTYYTETETYVENGQRGTRRVQRTRWTPVSGTVVLDFDDILIPATQSLPQDWLDKLEPWRLNKLQPYREDYLAGFTVEAYQLGLEPSFDVARQHMEAAIRRAVASDIGGNEQQIVTISPHYRAITFKHLLLPVWLSSYLYGGKTWRFLINGQTGEVQGERPWSPWKIGTAVGLALLVMFLLFTLFNAR